MSDPTQTDKVPADIGRNDPCPCGSGRKYKKCCQRKHQIEQQSAKRSRKPHDLIGADTIPWKVFELLGQVEDNSALALFWELGHDEGPFRNRYPEKSDFVAAVDAGGEKLPAGDGYELEHMRVDGPDTHLVIHEDGANQRQVEFQVVTLRRNEIDAGGDNRDVDHPGFRIWEYRHQRVHRDDYDDVPPLEVFGIEATG